ncbi:MAG: hypothetical protein HY513_03465 [Candidatus Aenigmarchaeota archaeon]|nr:hypothetical protein [Candidatus Aenigmarchaeota archaeon]
MLYVPQDFNRVKVHKLISMGDETSEVMHFPHLLAGKCVKATIMPSYEALTQGKKIDLDSAVSAGPCSVDVRVVEFFDESKKELKYPFVISPGTRVIGRSYLMMADLGDIPFTAYAETRSRFARRGLVCEGFYIDGHKRSVASRSIEELDFAFCNYSQNPLFITKPFSPVQVGQTIGLEMPGSSHTQIKIDGKDVTEERRINDFYIRAFYTTLGPDLLYFRPAEKAADIEDTDGFEALAVRTSLSDLPKEVDFCLTITKEEVDTNGSPVYMLPAHYLNLIDKQRLLHDTSDLAEFFERHLFSDPNFMPVTGNAGLINPGSNTRTVCENIIGGRDRSKYLQAGRPFAIVVPIPLVNGESSHEDYNGFGVRQAGIEL